MSWFMRGFHPLSSSTSSQSSAKKSKAVVPSDTTSISNELDKYNKDNTNFMSLKGERFQAKIVHIYDGDTMHVVFYVFGDYYKWNCRILGVDTPEIRTKNMNEKSLAIHVRDILREHLLDQTVNIICDEFDKYGRLLIDVEMPEKFSQGDSQFIYLSDWLINNKYAYPYEGGTKRNWEEILTGAPPNDFNI